MKINKIIKEEINKFMINESLTNVVYHFTNMDNLKNIVYLNRFILSSTGEKSREIEINKKYRYFFSLTRQRDSRLGYSQDKCVRITIDGDLLNQNFKGVPVNFWGKIGGKNEYMRNIEHYPDTYVFNDYNGNREINNDIKYQTFNENEDRLLSNKPIIINAKKYIKRIDILTHRTDSDFIKWLLTESDVKDIVNVYEFSEDFNSFNGKTENDYIKQRKSIINKERLFVDMNAESLYYYLGMIFLKLILDKDYKIDDSIYYIINTIKKYKIFTEDIEKISLAIFYGVKKTYAAEYERFAENRFDDIDDMIKYSIDSQVSYNLRCISNYGDDKTIIKIFKMYNNENKRNIKGRN